MRVGRVLAKLDAMGITDETVVVFTSDHGEFLGNHGLLHKGAPPYGDLCRVSIVTDRWRLTLYPIGEPAGANCSISRRTRANTKNCSTIPLTIHCVIDWPNASSRAIRPGRMPEPR